jgi:hypothetical protein
MSTEISNARKLLKKAFKVHNRGQKALARRLFAIARRAMRDAKKYDLLDTEIGPQSSNYGYDLSEELESLYWKGIYLYELYGKFKQLCHQYGV